MVENTDPGMNYKNVSGNQMNLKNNEKVYLKYGKLPKHECRQCCNYQLRKKGEPQYICIVYSNTCEWNGNYPACKYMFNIPFRGIRPRIPPLEEAFDAESWEQDQLPGQKSLFEQNCCTESR